ncbi:hypothetical protein FRC12_009406 [Ceratobasidium sp. 428]|nr:hypothetical protein FRC09_000418 [Ceratobasidium sp. 395]KAG8795815.1 hypothetical protein FRC12_009406 [Ceratobasidium sp. 428]
MRFTSYAFATTTALLGSNLVTSVPLNPKIITPPKHLYSFSLAFTNTRAIDGPLGTRVGLGLTGGNLTDPTGSLIGRVVPGIGGETGIIDKNGNLEIDVKVFFQFNDDHQYAYAAISGIGPLSGKPYDAHHIETNSSSRFAWNSYFVVANVSLVNPALLIGDAFYWPTS